MRPRSHLLLIGEFMGQFWQIYDEHYQPVRRFIAAMLRDDWAAEDLAQETFMRAAARLDTLAHPDKLKSWIFAIARNLCLDHLRRAKARLPASGGVAEPPPDLQRNLTQERLEREEMSRCVQGKIDLLPDNHRDVLLLYDLMEMSHGEAARVLGISVGAAKVRLHRARQALKEVLERECDFERDGRNVLVCLPVRDDQAPEGA